MHKHIWTLSFTLLLAAGCTQGDSTGSVDLGGGGNSDLGGGSSDLAMGGSPDDGGGGSQDGGTGGGPDGGTGGPDGGGGVLQPGVNLLAGQLGGSGSALRAAGGRAARCHYPTAIGTRGNSPSDSYALCAGFTFFPRVTGHFASTGAITGNPGLGILRRSRHCTSTSPRYCSTSGCGYRPANHWGG